VKISLWFGGAALLVQFSAESSGSAGT